MYKNQSKLYRFERREIHSYNNNLTIEINNNKNVYNWMNYKYIIKFIKNINDKKGKYRLIWKTVP